MAQVKHVVQIDLDPLKPVTEILAVIMAVIPYHPNQEAEILRGVQEAIDARLKHLTKGAADNAKPLRESSTEQKNQ